VNATATLFVLVLASIAALLIATSSYLLGDPEQTHTRRDRLTIGMSAGVLLVAVLALHQVGGV
jgi:multisubunit Na+/H+ antiporter MnhG subunit